MLWGQLTGSGRGAYGQITGSKPGNKIWSSALNKRRKYPGRAHRLADRCRPGGMRGNTNRAANGRTCCFRLQMDVTCFAKCRGQGQQQADERYRPLAGSEIRDLCLSRHVKLGHYLTATGSRSDIPRVPEQLEECHRRTVAATRLTPAARRRRGPPAGTMRD